MPDVPPTVLELVMAGAPRVILIVTARFPVPVALVAYTVTPVDAAVGGAPEINPVPISSDKPGGSALELKLVGELVAVMV